MPESGNTYESVLKSASRSSTKVYTFARILPTFAFFAVMLFISFFLWKQSKDQIYTDLRSEFDKAATSVMTRLATKGEQKKQVINSMSGLYDILVEVVKDYFELYGSVPTNTYESILSISYAPRIQKKDLDMFIYNTRSMGYYNFELKSSGVRNIYYPIEYLVPFEGNESRIGYDIGDIYDTFEILEEARLAGKIVSTPFFEIRPGIEGFMLLSPIYKYRSENDSQNARENNFKGFVVLELNSQLFFKNALGHSIVNRNSSFPSDTSIIFEIIDEADGNPMQVYSSSNFSKLGTGYKPYLKSSQPFKIADRELMVNFYSVPDFGGNFRSRLPVLILIGSIIASIALTLFVFSILTGRARALDLANRMTASQRRILDSSKDIISVLDTNGIWKSMNPASELILNYKPEELIGSNIENYYFEEYEQFKFESLFNLDTDENTEKLDLKMKNKYGNMVWVNWIFTSSKSDKLVYAIGRDVTYEKIAEQQALLKTKQIQLAELFSREANESKTFFIRRFSHQLRNSLTSIIGYIQLILQNVFDSPEEERLYLKSSLESAEEIFSFVTSSDDYLKSQYRMSPIKFEFIKMEDLVEDVKSQFREDNKTGLRVHTEDACLKCTMTADHNLTRSLMADIFYFLSVGKDEVEIHLNARENSYESVTEIQVTGPRNELAAEIIKLYKENRNQIIDALEKDKFDLLFNLAKTQSNIKRMQGSIIVESFGDEGNVFMLTIPLNRKLA